MSTKEIQEKLVQTMQTWQQIEEASVASTQNIIDQTQNPVIRMVAEIIQSDSKTHARVQQLIAELTEKGAVLSTDDLAQVWDGIEKHIAIEKQMVEYVEEALASVKGRSMILQEYLLRYLHQDEQKHDALLSALEDVKRGAYPYA